MSAAVIHKFVMRGKATTFDLPVNALPIHVSEQRHEVCIWCIVHAGAQTQPRHFVAVGTGEPLPENRIEYIGTAHVIGLVWHVFEVVAPPTVS